MALTLEGNETRHQLVVALLFQNQHARRQQCIVGSAAHPSAWDESHGELNRLLDLVVGL